MAVLIGSANINELGQPEGGKLGDQTGGEVCTQNWYLHPLGWRVIRAKDPAVREKIAQNMQYICKNDNVGYSFWEQCYGLINESKKYGYDASKVKVKCDTNCAKSVIVCIRYAGIDVADFSTFDEADKCKATGEFDIFDDAVLCKSSDYLLRGDILVTKTKGHTVVVLSNGAKSANTALYRIKNCAFCNLRKGPSINNSVVVVLRENDCVELLDFADNGWGHVRIGNFVGYVSPIYLKEEKRGACTYDTWLRVSAGKTGKQVVVVPKGSTVYLLGNETMIGQTKWYRVAYNGYVGWSSGRYIKPM